MEQHTVCMLNWAFVAWACSAVVFEVWRKRLADAGSPAGG